MTTTTLWIVVAVVAVVVLLALVLGVVLYRRRRISLREPDQVGDGAGPAVAPPRKANEYRADGGFSFSAGTDTPPAPPRPRVPTPETGAPRDTAPPAAPSKPAAPLADSPPADSPPADAPPVDAPDSAPGTGAASGAAAAGVAGAAVAAAASAPTRDDERTDTDAPDTAGSDTAQVGRPPAAPAEAVAPGEATSAPSSTETSTIRPSAPAEAPPAVLHPAPTRDPAPAPAAPAAPTDQIAPAEGRLERLRGRLSRSRNGLGQGLLGLLGAGELDEESWEDVEATLLAADLGPEMTGELIDTLRTELARRAVRTPEQAKTLLREVLTDALASDLDRSVRALPHDGRPAVLLVVGVNGTGKTTTTGKLARVLVAGGRHVVLGAADTFRAAAAEQLVTWGHRAGATVVRGPEGADPASVAFDAVKQGTEEGADAVLLDTAGRLHTKTGLMDELGKVKRVVSRQSQVDEVLLVLDATTGQNGLTQARVFGDVVDVTGVVLTKLDGTAKGGIVFRVQRELGVPVKLVGLGEGPDDLAPFEPSAFVEALLN